MWQAARAGKMPTTKNAGVKDDGSDNHCDKTTVGEAVLSVPNALPVRDDYAEALSYLVTKYARANRYSELKGEAQRNVLVPDQCPSVSEMAGDKVDYKIDAWAMLMPFLVAWMFGAAGVATSPTMASVTPFSMKRCGVCGDIHADKKPKTQKVKKQESAPDDNPDFMDFENPVHETSAAEV
jgi:hypothetical protein